MAQNNITVTLKQLDTSDQLLARRDYTASDTAPTVGEFRAGYLTDTSQATISLPFTTIRQLLFKNTHATAKITVVFTPNGGAEATINKVGPGGTLILWDGTAAVTGLGITSLKLTSDTAGGTYELFLGG
jgi:hypothetical protein